MANIEVIPENNAISIQMDMPQVESKNSTNFSETSSNFKKTDDNMPSQKLINKVAKKQIGDTQIDSVTPQKNQNIYGKQYDLKNTIKYDCDSISSSLSSTRQLISISVNSETHFKPVVEQGDNKLELIDIYKRAIPRQSVGFDLSKTDKGYKSGEINEDKLMKRSRRSVAVEEPKRNNSLTLAKSKLPINQNKTTSLNIKSNQKKSRKQAEIPEKGSLGRQDDGQFIRESRSNFSIKKTERKSLDAQGSIIKSWTNLSLEIAEKKSLKSQYSGNSIQDADSVHSVSQNYRRNDESEKEELQEVVEPTKILNSALLHSKPTRKQITVFEQAVSAPIKDFQRNSTGFSDTSLTVFSSSDHRYTGRNSLSSRKYSEDDLKTLLPHLDEVVDNNIRKSIFELNEIVETGKEEFQKLYSTNEDTGNVTEILPFNQLPGDVPEVFRQSSLSSLNQDADKGVAFKDDTELLVDKQHRVQKNSIQPFLVEDLSKPTISKSSIEIYLDDSKKENADSIADEMEDSGVCSSILDGYEYKDGFSYKYKGDYDENRLRTNFGCLKWLSYEKRKYCGYFQYNCLHGEGYYFIKRDGSFNFYDGKFYNNKLHGYGQIIYNNGDKFEGLFRDNTRFGPGIWSYQDGTQDVGIWYGKSIIRLSIYTSECIPILGRSTVGKLKLIEYKKVIPLNSKPKDRAYAIIEDLDADEDLKKRFKELYNPHVRNINSIFFNKCQYDNSYFSQEYCNIDVINTTANLSDFILVKKDELPQRLNEEIKVEMGHKEEIQKELNLLKKKIKSLRIQWQYDNDRLERCKRKSSNSHLQDETEVYSLAHQELFFKNVLEFLRFKLKKTKNAEGIDCDSKKVMIDSILTWNNDDTLIDILRHSFICRKSEDNVSFNVRHVLMGTRRQFGITGPHEKNCIKFLETCVSSNLFGALQLLANENINPNVCDSKGNTGLHLATWNHDTKMIGMLANHGANLDGVNDEGISPLNLCLLRYLESVHEVINWETSFLYLEKLAVDQENLTQWRPRDSFWNILHTHFNLSERSLVRNNSRRSMASRHSIKKKASLKKTNRSSHSSLDGRCTSPNHFIFILNFVSVPRRFATEPKTDLRSLEGGKNVSMTDYSVAYKQSSLTRMTEMSTLKSLLHYGADPNKEGVPYSPFFMALFSKSSKIVQYFLTAGADPNSNLYGMTPLQVVACLEPNEENCKIMQILIDNCSNPNTLSDACIWQECDKYLLGDFELECEIQPRGKDALHFICLREDFSDNNNYYLCNMAEKLINAKLNSRGLYLGHTHITMAIIKGNVPLVECLSRYLDLKRPLGFGLGNALTVLALSRYQDVLPFFICKKIIDLLLFEKVSPFEPVYLFCSIFEFLDVDSPPDLNNNQKVWKEYVHYVKNIRIYFKSHLQEDKGKGSSELSKIYIQEKSRKILDIVNRFKAVFYLYCFIREGCFDKYTSNLAKLIGNSEEALKYIRFIFNNGRMPRSYFSLPYVAELMKHVDNVNNVRKKIEVKLDEMSARLFEPQNKSLRLNDSYEISLVPRKSLAKSDETSLGSTKSYQQGQGRLLFRDYDINEYKKQLDETSFEESDDAGFEDIQKWVTEEYLIKCNVCYFCMHRTGKKLLRCPDCGIVKFCSKRCNYLSMKLNNSHPCPRIFYQDIYNEYRELIETGSPLPIYGIDLAFDNLRKKQKVFSLTRRNSQTSSVKYEDDTMKSYNSKSVKIRLHGGADVIQEKTFFLSPYIMRLNPDNPTRNRKNKCNNQSIIQNSSNECNKVGKNGISSTTHQRSVGIEQTTGKQVFKRNIELNAEKKRDFNLSEIQHFLLRNKTKNEEGIFPDEGIIEKDTRVEKKCTDDAKITSLLPFIEKNKHLRAHMKGKNPTKKAMISKKLNFPLIFQGKFRRREHSMKYKIISNNFDEILNKGKRKKNEFNLILEQRSSSVPLETSLYEQKGYSNEKIAIQMYQYFLDGHEDLDVESMFMPFTCYSGEKIFHCIPGDSTYFYQSFDDNTVVCPSSMG